MVDSNFILIFLNSYFLGLCAWNALVKCSETERVVLMGSHPPLMICLIGFLMT